ncbi:MULTISPECIES: ABC transporter ATP-binding protein [unclassified Rubrivivax]|uniref:ABC transporter ATP-binding protein n=1 Tax=unclassified Rubrivivax TaxID=2649762 RepID=UPI001E3AD8BA|nr:MULTISPECIES: ABC transporter ATP-binding protein [unclassified Rubrivivax]MCC9596517.1 ABC transporter ATP-binding protein [Rubrivivax sp. JA1055]MCC9648673.1 ABC transporter ATP-binding protein [Rubrivivax sp. JA1029]
MDTTTSPALATHGLEVRAGARTLLLGITASWPARGLFALVGANGAGKSTLLQALIGLRPAHAGEVRLLGRPLAAWKPRALAQAIGYLPQQTHSHWDLTVEELLQLAQAPPDAALIEACELGPLMRRRLHTLSGGEAARAALARAIAHRPPLLLADEPAAHLDLPHQHQLMRLLRACAADAAVLVVLHDLHLAARYCDHVTLLAGGRVLAAGHPDEVLSSASLSQAYGSAVARCDLGRQSFFTAES